MKMPSNPVASAFQKPILSSAGLMLTAGNKSAFSWQIFVFIDANNLNQKERMMNTIDTQECTEEELYPVGGGGLLDGGSGVVLGGRGSSLPCGTGTLLLLASTRRHLL
jgi:hypothetical protein